MILVGLVEIYAIHARCFTNFLSDTLNVPNEV